MSLKLRTFEKFKLSSGRAETVERGTTHRLNWKLFYHHVYSLFIINIFETRTVFPLFSLNFSRLPRVVITSSVAERRKRLEAIG